MFTSYYGVRDWVETFIPLVYGKEELGLARTRELLKRLGNPERKFKSIHIAGTSGKGSVAFYTSRMLQFTVHSSQFTVGLHISPHLVDIRERMQIFESQSRKSRQRRGSPKAAKVESLMPIGRFLRLFNEIKPVVEKIKKDEPDLTPSYFEILVAASFLYFAQEKVDWVVVEVGLGGRLDATNVLQPLITLITNVGLDHTEILGKTVEEIAYEKAGIIKSTRVQKGKSTKVGIPVVTGASGKALGVIEKVAREKKAPLIKYDTQSGKVSTESDAFSYIAKPFYSLRYKPIEETNDERLTTNAKNISGNLKLAVATVLALGIPVEQSLIDKAEQEVFAGRFEEIEPNVILDGAHNPDKIRALIQWIKEKNILRANVNESRSKNDSSRQARTRREPVVLTDARTINGVTLVLAFKKGKRWKRMVDLLLREFSIFNSQFSIKKIIATEFNAVTDTGRFGAVPAEEIESYIKSKWKVKVESMESSQEAVFEALQLTVNRQLSTVLVTGSLYLVGEARTMWYLPEF